MANKIQFTFEINDKGKVKVEGLTKSFTSLDTAINKVSADLKKQQTALSNVSAGQQNMISDAGLAGATLTELGRTISDANFGIRGMANNLSQLSTLFITLVSKRGGGIGGVTLAFKQLGKQLLGPLGIILAFQSLIAFMERLAMKNDELSKSVDKTTKAFSGQRKELKAIAGTALGFDTSDFEAIRGEISLLIEESEEFANGFEKLNNKTLEGSNSVLDLVDKFEQLLKVRDEITNLKSAETLDTEALNEAIIKRNELEKLFKKEKKENLADLSSALEVADELPKLSFEIETEFDPNDVLVTDELTLYLSEIEREMPSLLDVVLGNTGKQREMALKKLNESFGDAIKDTLKFKEAQKAINEKYDAIERKERFDHWNGLAKGFAQFMSSAAEINEQNKDLARASIVASAAATSVGIWESWFVKDPTFSPAPIKLAGAIATQAAVVASTIAALKSLNSNTPVGTGGSSGRSGVESQSPIFNVVGQSNVDQLGRAISAARSEPLKAYVVGNEITNQQELDNKVIQAATLG